MANALQNIAKIPELKQRILYSLAMLALQRAAKEARGAESI